MNPLDDPLDAWAAEIAAALGLDLATLDVDAAVTDVLDMTRDVAHGVARPAAPVTAFFVGLAAGRAGASSDSVRDAISTVLARLAERQAP